MEYRIDNIQKDIPDSRDFIFLADTNDLPKKVDLRKYANTVENQLNTGSCVANAAVSALEILLAKSNNYFDLSRLFLYYNLREPYSHLKDKDTGSYTRDAFKTVNKLGICKETTWSFDVSKVNVKPSDIAYIEALNHIVTKYERVETGNVLLTKAALAKGYPTILGMRLANTFYSITGKLETHKYKGMIEGATGIGGHAMNIVGYDDDLNGFIVENSWGDKWGDKGYFLLSYDVFSKDVMDIWTCSGFNGFEPEAEWIDTSPEITTDVPNETITNYQEDGRVFKATMNVEGTAPFTYTWNHISMMPNNGKYEIGNNPNTIIYTLNDNVNTSVVSCTVQGSGPLKKKKTFYKTFKYIDTPKPKPIEPEPIVPDPVDPITPVPEVKDTKSSKTKYIILGVIAAVILLGIIAI